MLQNKSTRHHLAIFVLALASVASGQLLPQPKDIKIPKLPPLPKRIPFCKVGPGGPVKCTLPGRDPPQFPGFEPKIINGRVIIPPGVSFCLVHFITEQSVTCERGTPGFKQVEIVDLSGGEFGRCTIQAPPDGGDPLIGCVGIPVQRIGPAVINGDTVLLPAGAASCTASNLAGATPTVECIPPTPGSGEATFPPGQSVVLPFGSASRCDISPGLDGPLVGCVGIPPQLP